MKTFKNIFITMLIGIVALPSSLNASNVMVKSFVETTKTIDSSSLQKAEIPQNLDKQKLTKTQRLTIREKIKKMKSKSSNGTGLYISVGAAIIILLLLIIIL
jgi:hypothetical protein